MPPVPVYLDCNATTPVDPRVVEIMARCMAEGPGNAGSRTHAFGTRALGAVQRAREHVATIVGAETDEVVFTSGATESNNLAILGLAAYGERTGRKHLVCTAIEHKAVLEPCEELSRRGFKVSLAPVEPSGVVRVDAVRDALRPDTLLVSVMHVNNETGIMQPLAEIAAILDGHPAYLHADAAQGFGKEFNLLRNRRLDMISVSGHKIYGPQGVGALVIRRRDLSRPPLSPLLLGGGQERGLRAGTLPVYLIAGLGEAARLALAEQSQRLGACKSFREKLYAALAPLSPVLNGDPNRMLPNVVNVSFPGLDSEAVMLALKDLVAISNGSACTSASYAPSHVLAAMALDSERLASATRWSWCHTSPQPDWDAIVERIEALR